jgi:hypothetical protein
MSADEEQRSTDQRQRAKMRNTESRQHRAKKELSKKAKGQRKYYGRFV